MKKKATRNDENKEMKVKRERKYEGKKETIKMIYKQRKTSSCKRKSSQISKIILGI